MRMKKKFQNEDPLLPGKALKQGSCDKIQGKQSKKFIYPSVFFKKRPRLALLMIRGPPFALFFTAAYNSFLLLSRNQTHPRPAVYT